jgi:hypothetical protein
MFICSFELLKSTWDIKENTIAAVILVVGVN